MAEKRRPARTLVHEGPKGLCECCDRKTEVSIGSVRGKPKTVSWALSEPLMQQMYAAVGELIREKTVNGKSKLYVLDPQMYRLGRAVTRNKLYFVEGEEGRVAGPFGPSGLKVFFDQSARSGMGPLEGNPIYVVATTHKSLSTIRNSPLSHAPAQEADTADDDGADLF